MSASLSVPHAAEQPSTSDQSSSIKIVKNPIAKLRREKKRRQGEIACAECRRLKVKCDKLVPCSTCCKRGCSALCPNGTIPPGEGSRFVVAASDHLQGKLTKLEERMHSLEDALAILQTSQTESATPHPLLLEPFVDENDAEDEEEAREDDANNFNTSDPADELGSLHVDESGSGARFFGPSGGAESLLLKAKEIATESSVHSTDLELDEIDPSYLPPEINLFYQSFPFTPSGIPVNTVQLMIESFLPPVSRAISLCETFLEHLSWMAHIVSRQHIVTRLIPAVYNHDRTQSKRSYGPHDLALLLTVTAVGALVDLTLPPYNSEAQHYHRLARSALCLQPVLDQQSVVTIKVLHLMSIYSGMSGKESNLENSYSLLNLASQVALKIGFHMDPSQWGIDGWDAYQRRSYFWNLLAGELWQSLITGRPPVIVASIIDCRMPTPEEESKYQQGEVPLGFGIWGFRYTKECMVPVAQAVLSAKPPSYHTVLELDRKIRDFTPTSLESYPNSHHISLSMRAFVRSHYQDLSCVPVQSYFARAMTDHPGNPLQSPYNHSFTTAYQSSCTVLESTREQFSRQPLLCARIWRMWSYAFSAAVIVGTIAARTQGLNLGPNPLNQLELACSLFQAAAETSSRARRALPILLRLRQKAYQINSDQRCVGGVVAKDDDELEIFGGKTRLVVPKRPSETSGSSGPSAQAPASVYNEDPYVIPRINPPQSRTVRDHTPTTSSGVPLGWEHLYRESSDPSYSFGAAGTSMYALKPMSTSVPPQRITCWMIIGLLSCIIIAYSVVFRGREAEFGSEPKRCRECTDP